MDVYAHFKTVQRTRRYAVFLNTLIDECEGLTRIADRDP